VCIASAVVDSGVSAEAQRLPEDGTVEPGAMAPYEERHRVEMVGPPLGS
jgi:hypothetical protein